MRRSFALFAAAALLLVLLSACGGETTDNGTNDAGVTDDGAANDNDMMSGVKDGIADGEGMAQSNGPSTTGDQRDRAVRYGNGDGNTSENRGRDESKNATANATLHGSYNNPTGTPAGNAAASVRRAGDDARFALMLDNAHVRDTDGFLLDGENPRHNTFW